jgi:NADPH-dependent 7-cyano-7-deazaguanine reductase QueF
METFRVMILLHVVVRVNGNYNVSGGVDICPAIRRESQDPEAEKPNATTNVQASGHWRC